MQDKAWAESPLASSLYYFLVPTNWLLHAPAHHQAKLKLPGCLSDPSPTPGTLKKKEMVCKAKGMWSTPPAPAGCHAHAAMKGGAAGCRLGALPAARAARSKPANQPAS